MKKVAKYKISRRLGVPIFEKCQTQKFILREQRRGAKPRRRSFSEYNKQLLEKQKVRYVYSISEKNLKNYVKKALNDKYENAGEALNHLLETRLDSVVYSLGLAATRRMARQMVSHGHFLIKGRRIDIPSCQVKKTDVIGIREGSKKTNLFQKLLASNLEVKHSWVTWDVSKKEGSLNDKEIVGEQILNLPVIFEYYSR